MAGAGTAGTVAAGGVTGAAAGVVLFAGSVAPHDPARQSLIRQARSAMIYPTAVIVVVPASPRVGSSYASSIR